MNYFVYILKSLKDGNLYIGSTEDVDNRLKLHNDEKMRSTKGRTPFVLIYTEKYPSRSEAVKRELFLKSPKGYTDKRKIVNDIQLKKQDGV